MRPWKATVRDLAVCLWPGRSSLPKAEIEARLKELGVLGSEDRVEQVLWGRKGLTPYAYVLRWMTWSTLRMLIVVTNRSILLIEPSIRPLPLSAIRVFKRNIKLGPFPLRWRAMSLGRELIWVHRRFRKAAAEADGACGPYSSAEELAAAAPVRGCGTSNVFLVLGLAAFLVGAHDLVFGTIAEVRLTGALFTAVGAFMVFVGASLLRDTWRRAWAPHLSVLAGLAGIGLSAYLLFDQITFFGLPPLSLDQLRHTVFSPIHVTRPNFAEVRLFPSLAPLISITAGIACLTAMLRRPKHVPHAAQMASSTGAAQSTGFWSTWPTRLSSLGLSVTFAFSLVQFWYTNQYFPTQGKPYSLTITQDVKDEGTSLSNPDMHLFSDRITVKNSTSTEIQILKAIFTVYGYRMAKNFEDDTAFDSNLQRQEVSADPNRARYVLFTPLEVLQVGTFLGSGGPSVIEPSQEFTSPLSLALPETQLSSLSVVRVLTSVSVARTSRLNLEYPAVRGSAPDCWWTKSFVKEAYNHCAYSEWRLVEPGWLWTATRGRQVLDTAEQLRVKADPKGVSETVGYSQCINQMNEREEDRRSSRDWSRVCNDQKGKLGEFFGLGVTTIAADRVRASPSPPQPSPRP